MTFRLLSLLLLLPSFCFGDSLILGGISHHSIPMEAERYEFTPIYTDVIYGKTYSFGGYSYHPEKRYNEQHPAIGYEHNGIEVSYFLNSYNDMALSVSRIVKNKDGLGARLGVARYEQGLLPIVQFGYFEKNYDLTFGMVSVLTLKIEV